VPSEETVAWLERAEAALGDLERSLKPDSVRRFLGAVARGGASVQLLTDDVVSWLEAHSALSRFRIVAGEPVAVDV
jgi:hypothetical protein